MSAEVGILIGSVHIVLHRDLTIHYLLPTHWSKVLTKRNVMVLEHLPYSPDLLLPDFLVSEVKKCSERTVICKHQAGHCKSDENTGRSIEKWFPGMLPEALLAKVCYTAQGNCLEGNVVFSY
jgi:hypothetical protein